MSKPMTITLSEIKKYNPSCGLWETLLADKGGDKADLNKPFPVSSILDSNSLYDAVWVLRCLPEHKNLWRKYAWWLCQHLIRGVFAKDERINRSLDVIWRHGEGSASDEELKEVSLAMSNMAERTNDFPEAWVAWTLESAAMADVVLGIADIVLHSTRKREWSIHTSGITQEQRNKLREILDGGTWS